MTSISKDKQTKHRIAELCNQIEKEQQFKIAFAVECGSLVYGFPSPNSDRDIRFVYYYPFEPPFDKYITIQPIPETFEVVFNSELEKIASKKNEIIFETVGWHIYKLAKLLMNSNPNAIEWLRSTIVYYGAVPSELLQFAKRYFDPVALFYHYFSICKSNFERFCRYDYIKYKKYLYPLMGAFKALYVSNFQKLPPLTIQQTMKELGTKRIPAEIISKTLEIIEIKKQRTEADKTGSIKIFDEYLESFIEKEQENLKKIKKRVGGGNKENLEMMDKIIQKIILESNKGKRIFELKQ